MASLCVEITTSRAIAAQLLRHKSFSFQEFSQRYAEVESGFQITEARRQDRKNRQNSIDDMSPEDKAWFALAQEVNHRESSLLYKEALRRGIAKECARMLLPLSTTTRLYMHGSVRSWITYLETRLDKSTQLEHRQIAEEIRTIFVEQFPTIAAALKANQESSDK
jgi:thymidylate synthase (FAD)